MQLLEMKDRISEAKKSLDEFNYMLDAMEVNI